MSRMRLCWIAALAILLVATPALAQDKDRDGDGVPDHNDNCPDEPNPRQENRDGDQLGDACDKDRDGDSVNEVDEEGEGAYLDNCPDTPNPDQSDVDGDGIGDACDPRDDRPARAQEADCPACIYPDGPPDFEEHVVPPPVMWILIIVGLFLIVGLMQFVIWRR